MSVTIIAYHQILRNGDGSDERHAVPVRDFEAQMRLLKQGDFRVADLRELGAKEDRPDAGDERRVIVTFDDGHFSQYSEGYRVLAENSLAGAFFVTTDWVGKPGYVDWRVLREMREGGMAIESHTMSHPILPDLAQEALRKELRGSKALLESRLECAIEFVSVPGGFSSRGVVKMAKAEGYRGMCTSVPGTNAIRGESFRILNRFMVTRETTLERFERIVRGDDRLVARLRVQYGFKNLVKMAIGNEAYQRLWSRYRKRI